MAWRIVQVFIKLLQVQQYMEEQAQNSNEALLQISKGLDAKLAEQTESMEVHGSKIDRLAEQVESMEVANADSQSSSYTSMLDGMAPDILLGRL